MFTRKRDERRELTDHLLRLRSRIIRGGIGVEFKPSVTQPRDQPPRWLAMLRASDSASWLGRVSFSFYRSDEAPTAHDLLHVLDDIVEACSSQSPPLTGAGGAPDPPALPEQPVSGVLELRHPARRRVGGQRAQRRPGRARVI